MSNSRPEHPAAEDEDQKWTNVKAAYPDLLSMSDSDSDEVETDGEPESETESDSETETRIPRSTPDLSSASTHREEPGAQTQPETDGDLHIHAVLKCGCDVMTCQFSNDGTLLAVGLSDGSIKVYSIEQGELVQTLRDREGVVLSLPVTGLRFVHTGQTHCTLLASYARGMVRCWYLWGGQCVWWQKETTDDGAGEREAQRQTLSLSVSPSEDRALTGGSDSAIHLYDLNTHQRLQIFTASSSKTVMDGHCLRVFSVTFHPDRETQFISGGWDSTVQFWDTRQQHSVRMLSGPHVCGDALHIHPSDNQILSGSWRKNNTLEVWDYDSGKKVADVPPDPHGESRIYTCQWFDQDRIIAAGGHINMLRIINRHSLTTESKLFGLSSAVFSSSTCPAGKWAGLIAATSGDRVFLLDRKKKRPQ
ncbi:WD repeat-containing protein 38-like [Trichomycterus rosablanca]|uniref:WD repeat-containing protein 38-like n=1 Tax=Trichomycterus rosablanca TaxID=2290929 RepID=UPI002F35F305